MAALRPSRDRKRTGSRGEDLASAHLTQRGYEVVARGWRAAPGEVDIIAREGDVWVFVEVKTRHGQRAGLPEEGLTPRKAARLVVLAQAYLAERELGEVDWRIDLVAIELDARGAVARLNHVRGAVTE